MAKRICIAGEQRELESVVKAVEVLRDRHATVKRLTDELTNRIRRFEKWLSKLPGRVETLITMPDPDGDDDFQVALRALRSGKTWVVEYAYVFQNDWDSLTWSLLGDAGVRLKVHAVSQLPRLIDEMVDSQECLVRDIGKAALRFDDFALRVGMPDTEGA